MNPRGPFPKTRPKQGGPGLDIGGHQRVFSPRREGGKRGIAAWAYRNVGMAAAASVSGLFRCGSALLESSHSRIVWNDKGTYVRLAVLLFHKPQPLIRKNKPLRLIGWIWGTFGIFATMLRTSAQLIDQYVRRMSHQGLLLGA